MSARFVVRCYEASLDTATTWLSNELSGDECHDWSRTSWYVTEVGSPDSALINCCFLARILFNWFWCRPSALCIAGRIDFQGMPSVFLFGTMKEVNLRCQQVRLLFESAPVVGVLSLSHQRRLQGKEGMSSGGEPPYNGGLSIVRTMVLCYVVRGEFMLSEQIWL